MPLKSNILILSALLFSFLLAGCSQPSEPEKSDPLASEFKSFQITTADNPGLPVSISGNIDRTVVLLEYPNTTIPGFQWIPRFDTDAVSVEIEGKPQYSGVGIVDFSKPVVYTLTSSSGLVQKITVALQMHPGWGDMGANPVLGAGNGVYNIRTGLFMDLNPYVMCRDSSMDLRPFLYNFSSAGWTEFSVGQPSGVLRFDTVSQSNQVWVVYENSTGNIEGQFMVSPNTWSGVKFSIGTAGTTGLHAFKGSGDRFFVSWIEDPINKRPQVWTWDGAAWNQIGGDLSTLHADSFAAVSAGGMDLYGVCTFEENPGTLHLYQYDLTGNIWNYFKDGGPLNKEEDQIVLGLFYDTDKKAPVVFTGVPDSKNPSFYMLKALYWDSTAGVWTNLNYIQPLSVSAGDIASLSLAWLENTPSLLIGNKAMTWDEDRWTAVGSDYTADTPVIQSLSRGGLNTYMAAYTTDSAGGELRVRVKQ